MKKMVAAFVEGAFKGSCMALCDEVGGLPPARELFQNEARRMMVANGSLTTAQAAQAIFKVQD